ncbi:hypothetical protein [Kingella potus]|nr:hypothetical protein [Kingella potus]UOO99879.1 hypothetical protein LVJ84_07285 [Kingella potus]
MRRFGRHTLLLGRPSEKRGGGSGRLRLRQSRAFRRPVCLAAGRVSF